MQIPEDSYLVNYENYYVFMDFVKHPDELFKIRTTDITLDTWDHYFEGLYNILLDGIETEFVSKTPIEVDFGPTSVELYPVDLLFNIIMWYVLLRTGQRIRPKHLFFDKRFITQNSIKRFMDDFVISVNRKRFSNKQLNNIIDDCMAKIAMIDEFSMFLMNTINLEDNIALMHASPEFYDILHAGKDGKMDNIPLEDIKTVSMDLTEKAIEIIIKSGEILPFPHSLANSFLCKEGINDKQYKEFSVNIGTKPTSDGGLYTTPLNTSFIMGGVADPLYYTIDSSAGRTAQMMSKINVGDSGNFARLLGLNNTDTYLHPDPDYDCHSKNYEVQYIENAQILNLFIGRYYRLHPNGMEHIITKNDTRLIGQTIYLRSPMTCASFARGEGICYKCYGDLAYTNNNINIGKMAAEILSSRLTQRLLSAKHLLETVIKKIMWSEHFDNIFEIEGNAVKIMNDINVKDWFIIIDPDTIDSDSMEYDGYDDDESGSAYSGGGELYSEYIPEFIVQTKAGEQFPIHTANYDHLYISEDLNLAIRRKGIPMDGKIMVPMTALEDSYIFFVLMQNDGLSKTMEELMDLLNKSATTKSYDRNSILQKFLGTVIKGGLYITSVHCEVLLANQLRAADDILKKPDWNEPNETYQLLTLNEALTNNPSVIITLMYQRLSKTLYNPLTFRKDGPSFIDLFFMENPTEYLSRENVIEGRKETDVESNLVKPMYKLSSDDGELD